MVFVAGAALLFAAGAQAEAPPGGHRRFASDAPGPWTDPHSDVRISRKGRLLWVDGETFRIPLQLARRIRARRSLGS